LTFAGRFEGSRDDRPLLGYDTPTGLTCPYTTPLDVTPALDRVDTSMTLCRAPRCQRTESTQHLAVFARVPKQVNAAV
ncbi:hypothetical protein ABDZ15_08660, partial [Mycobacterium canetti]|uniref:hypothetical protein n=1 Tax=Mycobacterium canetti TaxID=78331 RepID=UPI0032E42085